MYIHIYTCTYLWKTKWAPQRNHKWKFCQPKYVCNLWICLHELIALQNTVPISLIIIMFYCIFWSYQTKWFIILMVLIRWHQFDDRSGRGLVPSRGKP